MRFPAFGRVRLQNFPRYSICLHYSSSLLAFCNLALLPQPVMCIDTGDILLDFALEDERFFELAIRCLALRILEDTEFAPPQSVN
jgi:hypothetical protein